MKMFIGGLYCLFFFAMVSGIAIAFRQSEGLVETNYYEKGNGWFKAKATEQQLGLEITAPESLAAGVNEVSIRITSHGKPYDGADAKLFVGNVSSGDQDVSYVMRETAPGVYHARAVIPFKGKWLVRMDLAGNTLKTSRSWFYDIR
ncbi:MAG: FixH family protein [Chlorobiaceae bacterium]|nr:FixH family protein [Chlorobiaceae bacterium]